jgi:tetratricopeptide (TPR) repeat protein
MSRSTIALFPPPPRPVRDRFGPAAVLIVLLAAAWQSPWCRADEAGQPAEAAAAAPGERSGLPVGPLILDDVPRPLRRKTPRTEQEQDRLEAMSLFAAGRSLEHRGDEAEALRLYERALRWDPQAAEIVRSIIPLAFHLKRHAEAVRYALKAVEIEEADPVLLRRLAAYLTEEGDWKQAVKLYQRALSAREGAKQTAADILVQMEMGRLYHLAEQYAKAADCFARVLSALDHPEEFALEERVRKVLLGEPGPTYNLCGESFLLADRPKEALAAFEKAHQLAPNKGLLQLNRAQVYARTGRPEEALAALEACFAEKLASEGIAPYELLAEVLEKLGKKDELVARLEKLRAEDAENVPLGYFLAGRYYQAEQFDKAEPLYRQLLRGNAAVAGYRSLAEIYRKTKRTDALLMILGEAVEKTGLLEALGAESQAIAGDAELIRTLLEAARQKLHDQPEDPDYGVCFAAALLALEGKQYDYGELLEAIYDQDVEALLALTDKPYQLAAEFFEAAVKAKPDQTGELLVVWGVGLLVGERPAEAAKVFQRGIDEKSLPEDNPLLYFYLAGALEMDHRTDEALAAARKAAEVKPDSARFQSREAWVLDHAKRYDEAAKAYAEVIEQFDSDYSSPETREMVRLARLSLSNIGVIRQQLPQAEEWLEQVLDEFPDDPGANNDLGYLWADQNKHLQRALKMIQLAVEAEPENTAYRDSLGWVLYRLKRCPEAVAELEKAAVGKPEGLILDHLGDAYLKVDQPQKAKAAWRRAVEAFQKESEADKAKQVKKKIKDQK